MESWNYLKKEMQKLIDRKRFAMFVKKLERKLDYTKVIIQVDLIGHGKKHDYSQISYDSDMIKKGNNRDTILNFLNSMTRYDIVYRYESNDGKTVLFCFNVGSNGDGRTAYESFLFFKDVE